MSLSPTTAPVTISRAPGRPSIGSLVIPLYLARRFASPVSDPTSHADMGNSLSAKEPQNRLSKPPSNLPPIHTGPTQPCTDVETTTPFSYQSPWRGSTSQETDSHGGLGDMDFEFRPEKRPPRSALSVRVNAMKRRFSVPERPRGPTRPHTDDRPESEGLHFDRRSIVPVHADANTGLGVSFGDGTAFENHGTKRYSALRRLSLRAPGIASRVSGKLSSPRRPTKESTDEEFHMYTDDKFTPEELSSLDVDTLEFGVQHPEIYRASTPKGREYSYLGELKLGSLRVVNGCASPAPSTMRPRSFSDSRVRSVSRDDLSSLKHRSSQDTVMKSTHRVPSRHRLTPSIVDEGIEDADHRNETTRRTFSPENHVPASSVAFSTNAAEDHPFDDEAVDTSMSRDDVIAEEDTNPRTPARRKGEPSGLSKSDSGYSSASSKYAYSRRGNRSTHYGSSGGKYYTHETAPPVPERASELSKRLSNEHFVETAQYVPPDLSLTLPSGPRLLTEIPSCHGLMQSIFPDHDSLRQGSWPLASNDMAHEQGTVQVLPDLKQEDEPAKLTKSRRPRFTHNNSASKYLTRVKSLVNIRRQYTRRNTLHPAAEEEKREQTEIQCQQQKDKACFKAKPVEDNKQQQRVPNKLRRRSTTNSPMHPRMQTVKS